MIARLRARALANDVSLYYNSRAMCCVRAETGLSSINTRGSGFVIVDKVRRRLLYESKKRRLLRLNAFLKVFFVCFSCLCTGRIDNFVTIK